MTEEPDAGELDVRLDWPSDGEPPAAGPVDLTWPAPAATDEPGAEGAPVRRGIRLRPGDSRATRALQDEVAELRAEVDRLSAEVAVLRTELDGLRPGARSRR